MRVETVAETRGFGRWKRPNGNSRLELFPDPNEELELFPGFFFMALITVEPDLKLSWIPPLENMPDSQGLISPYAYLFSGTLTSDRLIIEWTSRRQTLKSGLKGDPLTADNKIVRPVLDLMQQMLHFQVAAKMAHYAWGRSQLAPAE